MKLAKTFGFLLMFASTGLQSQVMVRTEYFGQSNYRRTEGENDYKVGNSKGSASVYRGGINLPLSIKMDESNRPTIWSIGVGGAYASLNNRNFEEDLVLDEIMNLSLGISHLRPVSPKWSMLLVAGGGIYAPTTRFSQISFKQLLGNVGAVFICRLRPNLELGGGLALNNSFGYPMVFPAIYLNWMLEKKFTVRTSMMEGIEIVAGYRMNHALNLNLVAEMNGQMALVEKDGKDKIFSHQYMIVGLRPEVSIGSKIWIEATAGIHAFRPAEYSDRSLKGMFSDSGYYFQVAPYVSAGMGIRF